MDFMTIGLWIVQGLLGFAFLAAGGMKVSQPREKLIEQMGFIDDIGMPATRTIGALEILGGLGLILPVALNILPYLTPLAALGLMIVMVGAMATHVRRGEMQSLAPNLVLLILAGVVFFGYSNLLGEVMGLV
ncbi:MAG: DoxX family protein [Chloroflexota bacterium]